MEGDGRWDWVGWLVDGDIGWTDQVTESLFAMCNKWRVEVCGLGNLGGDGMGWTEEAELLMG